MPNITQLATAVITARSVRAPPDGSLPSAMGWAAGVGWRVSEGCLHGKLVRTLAGQHLALGASKVATVQ